ncbi:putative kinase [Neolecta irregularis DAH-3]|uniref:Endocytosis protein 3 n=1 Tax=Neolecta irregularis (strain DAH-3) TaxID=1198029 RepID=A0A1U7LWH4_NEOID|nr:putative kinase [Neolecta irregularis DAH-3]|eukprot:OLL27030.1 putative kinase [Neolecta irregularis DAH-3]
MADCGHRIQTACRLHSLLQLSNTAEGIGDEILTRALPDATEHSEPGTPGSPNGSPNSLLRCLTKKELSDMVFGVRELSKGLGSPRIHMDLKTIMIITKPNDEDVVTFAKELALWILKTPIKSSDGQYTVFVDFNLKKNPKFTDNLEKEDIGDRLKYWTPKLCTKYPNTFDLVVTLGGDGTVLYTSTLFQRVVPPVLSFSLGSLGFLTKFDFSNYQETLKLAFESVAISLRMRFECTVSRSHINKDDKGGQKRTSSRERVFSVLNELVVDRGPQPFMTSLELYGDEEHLTSVQADGLCISTPTGSTAYSLAAGGSLTHPDIPAMLISPICPHSLSFRPLLVPDSMTLRICVPQDARSTAWCSFDGRNRIELKQGDYIAVSASRFPFPTCLKVKQSADCRKNLIRDASSKVAINQKLPPNMTNDRTVTEAEQAKYWEIFTSLTQTGVLTGQQAKSVLLNSKLPNDKLENIWDLADIDGDGCLDFEEFCIAMRLIFDTINGVYPTIPGTLPDFLVPASKSHLVAANKALSGNETRLQNSFSANTDDSEPLSDNFDWYMSPGDKERYDSVYTTTKDLGSLTDLYSSLNVPDRDLRRAWDLVNPRNDHTIGKDQSLVFLHILNQRHRGSRIPNSVPASLRATFEKTEPIYDLAKVRSTSENLSTSGKKSEFAEGYLARMGLGGRSTGYESKGTDFTLVKDTDWEEVRLRRQLEDLERKCEEAEAEAKRKQQTAKISSKVSLARRELEQLLEYKKKQLQIAKDSGRNGNQVDFGGIKSDIDMLSQNVEILQQHLSKREKELEEIKIEISSEKT